MDDTLPRKSNNTDLRKQNNVWWTPEISNKRASVLRIRRRLQRARRRKDSETASTYELLWQTGKTKLRKLIRAEKTKAWRELCATVDRDVWGKPYKAVMKAVKEVSPPANLSKTFATNVLCNLFPREDEVQVNSPTDRTFSHSAPDQNNSEPAPINATEMLNAARHLKNKRAPGPDGMTPDIIKTLITKCPLIFLNIFNSIFRSTKIPDNWKIAKVILLRKPGKDLKDASAFRAMCLLNTISKIYETMIKERLMKILGSFPFDHKQYGFTYNRSTIDAPEVVRREMTDSVDKQTFGMLVALDVRNAFNTLRWCNIINELTVRNIPARYIEIIKNY